ncbi:MAG: nucleotidyltransferase substrate binding protein [Curvibacter sp.]|jgi:nucleotidyltransferase substrate binding protein (TIGR01987 family)|nr:nucleotidyltransferase substrate binding protein [Curvibacter sp.]
MATASIDLAPLHKALEQLDEALRFWQQEADTSPLKRHLRAAVIQSFEFTYELSMRMLRRVLMERAMTADTVLDLSFNDLLRKGADAGLLPDAAGWRRWREMRNATSHTYDESRAAAVAHAARDFLPQATQLALALGAGR